MLKIKDDVDLKDLKKFGFIHITEKEMLIPRYRRGRITIYYDIDVKLKMSIEEINKTRGKNKMTHYYNRVIYIELCGEEVILFEDLDNDVYDLIQANLVDKVEE